MSDREAVVQLLRLWEQALDDVGIVLPAWVHLRAMDRFQELLDLEVNLTFQNTTPDAWLDEIVDPEPRIDSDFDREDE